MSGRLLIIGQEKWAAEADVGRLLNLNQGWHIERSSWTRLVPESLQASALDLIVAMAVSEMECATRFFRWLRGNPVVSGTFAILPSETDAETLRASVEVVDDFVIWPARVEELQYRVSRILDSRHHGPATLNEQLRIELGMAQLVGNDPAFVKLLRRIPAIARTDAPVLITGETGTGKEMCAQAIHCVSRRRDFPLIPVDCAGVPQELFENEMFGHARGAFTDARQEQKGLAAMAASGTLFLDEVDALSVGAQAKLLRFLQNRMYKQLGADHFKHSDVRVIAATNRNIEALVKEGRFRSDLYYRLNVLRLELPPLRKRPDDIPLLAHHFLSELCACGEVTPKSFSPAALQRLACYDWPGNVRELYNVVQRAMVQAHGVEIKPAYISVGVESPAAFSRRFREARTQAIETFEKQYVKELFFKNHGNVTQAAREAGKERRSFGRMVKKYGIRWVNPDPGGGS